MSVGKIRRRSWRRSLARSRGVISVVGAIFAAALVVAALGALDVGNVFLARRTLQRTADLAAIAGAQTINAPSVGAQAGDTPGCTAAKTAAAASVASNAVATTPTVVCGRWDPTMTAAAPYFSSTVAANVPQNAVQVTVSRDVPTLFVGKARNLQATAIAKSTNIASFSLATQVAQLQGGVINALLNKTLGTSVNLQIGDYTNILGGQIKLLDLAKQLNVNGDISVASVSSLLGATVGVADLLKATVTVLSRGTVADMSASTALGTIAGSIPGSPTIAISNILGVTLANPESAASAYVNALDLLTTVALANGTSQIDLTAAFTGSAGALSPGINLLPSVKGTKVKLIVGTPPQIVIGESGQDANGNWRTQAHTADIALFADLYVSVIPPALSSILGSPLTFELPLYVEGFQATAPLQSIQCGSTPDLTNMNVAVSPGIAHAIISNDVKTLMASATTTQDYLNYMHGPTYQQPARVLTFSLSSIPLAKPLLQLLASLGVSLPNISLAIGSAPNGSGTPTQGFSLSVQSPGQQTVSFTGVGSLNTFNPQTGQANSNQVGAQAGDLLAQLIAALSPQSAALYATVGNQSYPLSGFSLGDALQTLLTQTLGPLVGGGVGAALNALITPVLTPLSTALGGLTTTLLQPLLTALDTLIVPLLQLLGVQIGIATVHAVSLQCGEAQLVQ
ncbi:TadG family pilus assembly protein [Paraburkholderia fungorum]|uniref:TadG family pilus assembly protein n=1 Tax=Paraburkholderia fungorum TaxID=134537 RepID=UPI0038BB0FC5